VAKETYYLRQLSIDGRIILKLILK